MRFGRGGSIVDDGEFDISGDSLVGRLANKVVDARDCAVVLEQQLAEAERLLRLVVASVPAHYVFREIRDYVDGIGAL